MGSATSSEGKKVQIKIATLNYSGILKSPYEFFQNEDIDENSLSENMKNAIQSNQKNFAMEFGPFDKKWQQDRFTPIYKASCGIKNNVHLMSKRDFDVEWDSCADQKKAELDNIFNEEMAKLSQKADKAPQQKNKTGLKEYYLKNLKMFDFLVYKTILEHLYTDPEHKTELQLNFEKNPDKFQLNSKKYKEYQKKRFQKPFLDEKKKIDFTINAIRDLELDILFLQEANVDFVKAVEQRSKNLRVVKSPLNANGKLLAQSVIIIRENKQKFPEFTSLVVENSRLTNNIKRLRTPSCKQEKLTIDQIKRLNFNSDTVVQFFYNIILICPHLSSKQEQNEKQMALLIQNLKFLKQKFPECHIILAGDLNNKYQQVFQIEPQDPATKQKKKCFFNVVPIYQTHFTVNKTRTHLQAQKKKAGQKIQEVKDYIISDLKIEKSQIQTIDKQVLFNCFSQERRKQKIPIVPNSTHPYDHFLLTATIVVENGLEHVTHPEYKLKYVPDQLSHEEQDKVSQYEVKNKQREEFEERRMAEMVRNGQEKIKEGQQRAKRIKEVQSIKKQEQKRKKQKSKAKQKEKAK